MWFHVKASPSKTPLVFISINRIIHIWADVQHKWLLCCKKGWGDTRRASIFCTQLPTVWEAGAFSGLGGMGQEVLGGGTQSWKPEKWEMVSRALSSGPDYSPVTKTSWGRKVPLNPEPFPTSELPETLTSPRKAGLLPSRGRRSLQELLSSTLPTGWLSLPVPLCPR